MRTALVFLALGLALGTAPDGARAAEPTTTPTPRTDDLPALDAAAQQAEALGDPAGAIVALSKLLRAVRAAGDPRAEAGALARLGRVLRGAGRYAEALTRFEEARDLDRSAGHRVGVAADLGELAATYARLGDARRAATLHREAALLYQELKEPRSAADALVHLGLDRRDGADLAGAEEATTAALSLYRAAHDASGEGDALTNLASLQAATGRFGLALTTGRAAVEAFAHDDAGRGAALHNLGNLYARMGDLDQAAALHRQARPLLRSREDRMASDLALADLLVLGGRAGEALPLLDAALRDARPPERAALLHARWLAEAASGLPESSRAAFLLAAADADPRTRLRADLETLAGAVAKPSDLRALGEIAESAAAQGAAGLQREALLLLAERSRAAGKDPLPALRAAATSAEEGRRALAALGPAEAARFVRGQRVIYERLVDCLLAAGEGAAALLYSERLRLAELGGAGPSADPDAIQLDALGAREAALSVAREQALAQAEPERIAALDAELAALRVVFSRTVDTLRSTHPDFDTLVRVDPTDIEAWQAELADDEVVLQPILLPDRLVLLVFSSGPLVARDVAVDPAELQTRLSRALRTLRSGRVEQVDRLNEHLDFLGKALLAPVFDLLRDRPRVAIVAAGALRYLPFQILRHEGRYLVQTHEVVNVTNVGSLKHRPDDALRLGAGGLLALGNPDGSLPAADQEVDRLGALYPGSSVAHGPEATLTRLLADAPNRRVLHLATHGVLDAAHPEESYIVLARGGDDDGRLGYLEIPGLFQSLRGAGLVVLSACETAVPVEAGEAGLAPGGLEIAGLANQFRRAGVPRLLASLWPVADEATQSLMVTFYEGLGQGRAPPAALAAAQRRLLAAPATAHPYFWAPFVLVGTPR